MKSESPLISVIMPFHNASSYMCEAIKSVLNQTFTDFELLLINDGSTDNSLQIARSFADPRIRLVSRKNNFIQSLNYGLTKAQAPYIVRMDADDVMMPQRLEKQYQYMENHPQIDVCGSWATSIGDYIGEMKVACEHQQIISTFIVSNSMLHPTVIIRKESLRRMKLKYKVYPFAEDYKLWIDMAMAGARFANLPEVLLQYRISEQQVTTRHSQQMYATSLKIQLEYAEHVMNLLADTNKEYLQFFENAISMLNSNLLSTQGLLQIVYWTYKKHLEKDESV